MNCKKCGANIPAGEIECPSCHTALALMSQIKTEEDKAKIEMEKQEEVLPQNTEATVTPSTPTQNLDIRFEADVLKEVNAPSKPVAPVVESTPEENPEAMPVLPSEEASVDREEVKKALEQYSPSGKKDLHFFLPIIIGMIAVILIVIGILYGIKSFF